MSQNDDSISRKAAIDITKELTITVEGYEMHNQAVMNYCAEIMQLPSAQPFHNITMTDVLKYIDDMPEDVWQEFTACLECRGWELQRRTAKWCGGDFA